MKVISLLQYYSRLPVMRARSCALHSDSPEEFLQMAQAAISSPGVFYDDRLNRKLRKSLGLSHHQQSQEIIASKAMHQHRIDQENPFSKFDFSSEIQVDREEQKELEKMENHFLSQTSLAIITDDPNQVTTHLSRLIGLSSCQNQNTRGFNLLVSCQDRIIFKYWIISREFLNREKCLVQVYLDRCSAIYEMEKGEETGGIHNGQINWNIPELLI